MTGDLLEPDPLDHLRRRAEAVFARGYRLPYHPLVIAEAHGARIVARDGSEYLDFNAMAATVLTGYGHPAVRAAIVAAVESDFQQLTPLLPNEASVGLAERLVACAPVHPAKRVWYGCSSGDAIDCLVKIAPAAARRPRLVSYIGAHHGMTIGSGALSGDMTQRRFLGAPNIVKAPFPDPYRCPWGPCDRGECSLRCLDFLDEYVLSEQSPHEETAAIFIEPIQSNAGEIVPPANYLPALRALCDRHGIWLIADEVKTGLGRTGLMFAIQHAGITADAVVLGKGLGGGLPLAAIVGRDEILDVGVTTAQTLSGSPVACSAALATLSVIEGEALVERAAQLGRTLHDGLAELMNVHRLVGDVRGLGLMAGIELVTDRTTREPGRLEAIRVGRRCFDLGLLVKVGGRLGNVIGLTPPLTISEQDLAQALAILDGALADVASGRLDREG
jgi:4-aminobutyrate aminotransferase